MSIYTALPVREVLVKKMSDKRKVMLIAVTNISVTSLCKMFLLHYGAYGIPLIVPVILWYFIIKKRQWANIAFFILTIIRSLLGCICFVLLFAYVYRGFDAIPCVLNIILAINYAVSLYAVRKILVE